MGQLAAMRLFVYQPEVHGPEKVLKIEGQGDSFAGIVPGEVRIDSRYNEQRIVIACKRVLDHVLSTIAVRREDGDQTAMAQPVFLTRVSFPSIAFVCIIIGLIVAPILLSITPDFLKYVGGTDSAKWMAPTFADFLVQNSQGAAAAGKPLAAVVTLLAGFLGFRKIPLGR